MQQALRHRFEKLVTGRMSQGIVDLLKPSKSRNSTGSAPPVPPRKRDSLANHGREQQSIRQPGQRIMFGQMGHLLRLRPRHAYVAKNDHRSGDLALAVVDGGNESSMKTS